MCWSLDANDPRAARAVRKAAVAELRAFTDSDAGLSAAELIIGELISNAARHSDGYICVELTIRDGNAAVRVHDTSPVFELDVRRPPDEFSESGRGLFIIAELALKISVAPLTGIGKCVTVTFDIPVTDEAAVRACRKPWLRHDEGMCMAPRIARFRM
jgi:anti-sigma regulatory factor (Ser/Thr protein kinase)